MRVRPVVARRDDPTVEAVSALDGGWWVSAELLNAGIGARIAAGAGAGVTAGAAAEAAERGGAIPQTSQYPSTIVPEQPSRSQFIWAPPERWQRN